VFPSDRYVEELQNDATFQEVMVELSNNTGLWCRIVFPRRFKRSFSKYHEMLFEALDDRSIKKLLVIAHRDFGKTSILQLGYASKEILFDYASFVVPISCSATHAIMQSENLKKAIVSNDFIRKHWGELRPEEREAWFSKNLWTMKLQGAEQEKIIVPRGSLQQLRGLIYGDSRPNLILVDDLEDPQKLLSEEMRDKQRKWFFGSMENIVDIAEEDWRTIVMGTLVHLDCLLARLREDKDNWTTVNLPLCDRSYHTLWPERFSQEKVDGMIAGARAQKQFGLWCMEYMNEIVPGDDQSFHEDMFVRYDPNVINLNDHNIAENLVIVDPAKTAELRSADSGMVAVGVGLKENLFFVREAKGEKYEPAQLIDETFAMAIRNRARIIAIEVTGIENWIKHPFMDMAEKKGYKFHFIWLKAKGKKEFRVRQLLPYYSRQHFRHSPLCAALEQQLLAFPYSQLWDIMDALAYLPSILEDFEVYFQYYGGDESKQLEEEIKEILRMDKEEEELDEEEGWRILK